MKAVIERALCIGVSALVLLSTPLIVAAVGQESLPPYHWSFEILDELPLRGYIPLRDFTAFPVSRSLVRSLLDTLTVHPSRFSGSERWMVERLTKLSPSLRSTPLFRLHLEERFAATTGQSSDSNGLVVGEAIVPLTGRLLAVSAIRVDQNLVDDPTYVGKKFRRMAGYVERAYLLMTLDRISVKVGRDYAWWGPGRYGQLALSHDSRPFDLVQLAAGLGPVRLTAFAAALDPMGINRRWFSGHRLDWQITDRIRAGASETVLYAGPYRPMEWYLVNPLVIFYGENQNETSSDVQGDENEGLAFDLEGRLFHKTKIYGELLIDDYQMEKNGPSELEPTQAAGLIGVRSADPLGIDGLDVGLEYVRIQPRTYNQASPDTRYHHRNRPIGHPLGTDVDELEMDARFWMRRDLRVAASLAYRRKGEEEVTSPWTAPWLSRTVEQGYDEPFPTGVVERHRIGKLRMEYEPFRECIVDLGLATDRITNDGHRPGVNRRETTFDLRVRYWGGRLMGRSGSTECLSGDNYHKLAHKFHVVRPVIGRQCANGIS